MRLVSAIIVFIIGNYLKLLAVVNLLASVWKYYTGSQHVYIIILELLLNLSLVAIMFASLALTKMDCERLANYFMLPVFLALIYTNIAAYQTATTTANNFTGRSNLTSSEAPGGSSGGGGINDAETSGIELTTTNQSPSSDHLVDSSASATIISTMDSIELALHNLLALMALLHLSANVFSLRATKGRFSLTAMATAAPPMSR